MRMQEGILKGIAATDLYWKGWLPDSSARAIILFAHGLAEHISRYHNLIDHLVPVGYALYGLDHQGHGKSAGRRGYVERFRVYLDDFHAFHSLIKQNNPAEKFFLLGHSMGGLIATAYAAEHQQDFAGLIVSAPLLKPGKSINSVSIALARMMSLIAPKMGIAELYSSPISSDRSVVEAYDNDPLVYRGKISARLGAELLKSMAELEYRISSITLPLLIMQGSDDKMVNPESVKFLYDRCGSEDKTLKIYNGYYHEIFNEPGRDSVFADLEEWLNSH